MDLKSFYDDCFEFPIFSLKAAYSVTTSGNSASFKQKLITKLYMFDILPTSLFGMVICIPQLKLVFQSNSTKSSLKTFILK